MQTIKNIDTQNFLSLLQAVMPASGGKVLALQHILFTMDEDTMSATASNMEQQITMKADAGDAEGLVDPLKVLVPAKKTAEIVKSLHAAGRKSFSMKIDGDMITLSSGRGRYKLQLLPAEQFPLFEESTNTLVSASFPSDLFFGQMNRVTHAMATGDVRTYLNGMLWEFEENNANLVATDGHRMACTKLPIEKGPSEKVSGIVPGFFVKNIGRFAKLSDTVDIALSTNHATVATGNLVAVSKLIDGKYPAWDRVIPRQNKAIAKFDANDFTASLKRVSLLSDDGFKKVSLELTKNEIKVQNCDKSSADLGEDSLDCSLEGLEALKIGINPSYVTDALSGLGSAEGAVRLGDEISPLLFLDKSETPYLAVVMPVRM